MRHERMLGKHVWYWVSTAVNAGGPLFELPWMANLTVLAEPHLFSQPYPFHA
jgi:hypothetical protein